MTMAVPVQSVQKEQTFHSYAQSSHAQWNHHWHQLYQHQRHLSMDLRERVPRGWRNREWLNAFPNGKALFSFYRWEAEGKGTWVTLAHTTRPEATSNFLNTVPGAQEGPLGSFTFLTPTKSFSTTTQIKEDTLVCPYPHLETASFWGIFYFQPPSFTAKELSTSVLEPCRATAKSCSTAEQRLYGQDNCYFHQFFSKPADRKSYSWLACLCNTSRQENTAHTIGCGPH